MLNKIKKYGIALSLGVFALGLMVLGAPAHAVADPTLTNLTASSSGFVTDNLSVIMDFIVLNFFKILGAGLGILALYWIARKIYSLFRR